MKKNYENEEKIREIYHKELKIQLIKDWLVILFFLACGIVAAIYCGTLFLTVAVDGKAAAVTILTTLIIFSGLLISGYCYNKFLSKKLDKLWDQKKLL